VVTGLGVTGVDAGLDEVSGVAAAGSQVHVWVNEADAWRNVEAGDGTWLADFGVPGDEPDETALADLEPGSNGGAQQCDADNDCTQADWWLARPVITVSPDAVGVWGGDFEPEASVTVTIDGTSYGPFPTDEWGNFGANWDPAELEIGVGSHVEATDGTTTKTHDVLYVEVTEVDADGESVSGLTDADTTVVVEVHDLPGWVGRNETSSGAGAFTAFFAAPGDEDGEEGTADLEAGSHGSVDRFDDDGDATRIHWSVRNPVLNVEPQGDWLWGDGWLPGGEVTIWVDGVEHSTLTTDQWGNFGEGWDPTGTDLTEDSTVMVTQGDTSKTHDVTSLAITSIDVDSEIMTGTADGPFDIWVHHTDAWRHVDHDGVGEWSVDWSVPGPHEGEEGTTDLMAGTNGNADECDDDGDCTWAGWSVQVPSFSVRVDEGEVHGYGWALGSQVTMEIDDLANGEGVDYTATLLPEPAPWDAAETWVQFTPAADGFALAAGQIVTMANDEITKAHVVTPLQVTDVDPDADTVSGSTGAGATLRVEVYDGGFGHEVMSDENGDWTADFSPGSEQGEFDLVPGTQGEASEYDEDGDSTKQGWQVPGGENQPPEILEFSGPELPLSYKLEAFAEASFFDPDGDEGLTVMLDWGDGTVGHPEPGVRRRDRRDRRLALLRGAGDLHAHADRDRLGWSEHDGDLRVRRHVRPGREEDPGHGAADRRDDDHAPRRERLAGQEDGRSQGRRSIQRRWDGLRRWLRRHRDRVPADLRRLGHRHRHRHDRR
jgi:hypothetical protein